MRVNNASDSWFGELGVDLICAGGMGQQALNLLTRQ
jgi:hypothetical protein